MSTPSIDQPAARHRLPVLVYVLAAGIFLMGTTEFMIAGLLPDVAADLGVDIARAGLLATAAFNLGTPPDPRWPQPP